MMKNKALLKEENLLTLFSQNNFIIPEIQREYVWGNHKKVVLGFFNELKKKIGQGCLSCNQPAGESKINIGFLYSYKPDYVKISEDRYLDENLIDGQQRITTLFLLLFFCSIQEGKKQDFLSLIRFEEMLEMSFTFKVRETTKRFLLELVAKVKTKEEFLNLDKQIWFLSDYQNDISIQAIVKTLKYIHESFDSETRYYYHLLSNVVFWHFKTEATSQGEELYITMNARGQDLTHNELVKASVMMTSDDITESGKKWEDWQQFFWKNRLDKKSVNQSADQGYNGLLNIASGLEAYLKTSAKSEFVSLEETENQLSISVIEQYVNALKFVQNNKDVFKSNYENKYTGWVDKAVGLLWELVHSSTDWFIDYNDANRGTERRNMAFVWSILYYVAQSDIHDRLSLDDVFRYLRIVYVRYNNRDRSVSPIMGRVDNIIHTSPWDQSLLINEEIQKYKFVQNQNLEEVKSYESIIWEIEDHPLNLNGENLGNINSSHVVDFESNISLPELQHIKNTFYKVLPVNQKGNFVGAKNLQTLLFFYGKYWRDKWASYYWRHEFDEWGRIVRDQDAAEGVFKTFFNDVLRTELDDLYSQKVVGFDVDFNTKDQLEIFKWYASQLGEKMWSQGNLIAFEHYNYTKMDKNFPGIRELVKNKKTFNGGNQKVLSKLLPK